MSQLAFDENGEPIDLPPTAAGWRVRRMKGTRGAPGLVYGSDGAPLVLPLEMDIEELRREVGSPGRYKLEAVDDRRRLLEVGPAFVVVPPAEPGAEEPAMATPASAATAEPPSAMAVVMEAMRQNAEMARTIVDRFPAMLEASAILLKAADGAGLPAREPQGAHGEDDEDKDEDEDDDDDRHDGIARASSKASLIDLLVQLGPVLATLAGDGKLPSLAEMLDWRKAGKKPAQSAAPKARTATAAEGAEKPRANTKATPDAAPQASAEPTATAEAADAAAEAELPALSAQAMAHFLAIQAALTPEEAALARAAAAELPPRAMRVWFDELSALSVPEAAERIRALLATSKREPASKQKTTASQQEAA